MTLDTIKTRSSSRKYVGSVFIVLAVFLWGISAPLAKYLIVNRYDTLMIVQTRTLISFLVVFCVFVLRKRSVFEIEWHDLAAFGFLGIVGLALTNFLYYYTVVHASVATAILIQYTSPVWVVLYVSVIKREEPLTLLTLLVLLMALTGCVLAVTNGALTVIQLPGVTLVTGVLSSLTYAVQIVMTKHLLKKYSLWTVLFYMFGFATLFWFFLHPPWSILAEGYTLRDWGVFALFAVVSILLPQTSFAKGLSMMTASGAGIMTTLEPVFAVSLAFFILGETIGVFQILGGLLILGAVIVLHVLPYFSK